MSVNSVHCVCGQQHLPEMLDFGGPNTMSCIRFIDKNHTNQMSLLSAAGIDDFVLIWLVNSNMPESLYEWMCIPNKH